jgi:hypothetical protein
MYIQFNTHVTAERDIQLRLYKTTHTKFFKVHTVHKGKEWEKAKDRLFVGTLFCEGLKN